MNNSKKELQSKLIERVTNGLPIEVIAKLNNISIDEMKERLSNMTDHMISMMGLEDVINESNDNASTVKQGTKGIPIAIVAKEFNMSEEDIMKYYPQFILSSKVNNVIKEKEIEEMMNNNRGMDHDGDIKPEDRKGDTLFDTFAKLTKKQLEEFMIPHASYTTCKHKHLCDTEKRTECKKKANSAYGRIASDPNVVRYMQMEEEMQRAIEQAFPTSSKNISQQRKDMFINSIMQTERDMDIIFNRNPSLHPTPFISFKPIEDILKPGLYESFDWDGDIHFEGAYVADPKNPVRSVDERVDDFHKKLFREDMPFLEDGSFVDIIANPMSVLRRLGLIEDEEESVYDEYTSVLEEEDKDAIYNIITLGESSHKFAEAFMEANLLFDEALDIKNILNLFLTKCSYERPLSYLLRSEIYLHSMLVENTDLATWRLDVYKDKVVINGNVEITEKNFIKLTMWFNEAKEKATKICIAIHE